MRSLGWDVPEIDYTRYSNRELATVPLVVLAVALLVLGGTFALTGAPVQPGIDFTGGTELTVQTSTPREDITAAFDAEPESVQSVSAPGTENRYIIVFGPEVDRGTVTDQAEQNLEPSGDREVVAASEEVSASFGANAQQTALVGLTVAFVGMSLLAFALFRTFVPSVAIIISAFSDIVIPLAVMNLVGISLSLGTVAALLMLIGYSVDSDILLNNHILRRSGEFYDSTGRAMHTGVTMTLTSMSAMAVMALVATLFQIDLLASIGFVLFVGLAADLMNTYMLNLSLLRWYKLGGGV
jgi:preprotein translocase subunit SecF